VTSLRALVLGLGPSLQQLFPPAIAARFVSVPDFLISPLLPGDLILIRETTNAIHLGVVLANRRFAHVLRASGVQISSLDDPTYGTRLTEVLRPLSDS
jgi:cell wall-associated NlpC family hydrolase